jgi:hypothetical protein
MIWDELEALEEQQEAEALERDVPKRKVAQLQEELDTWMSVFPDIAPSELLPAAEQRAARDKELEGFRRGLKVLKAHVGCETTITWLRDNHDTEHGAFSDETSKRGIALHKAKVYGLDVALGIIEQHLGKGT